MCVRLALEIDFFHVLSQGSQSLLSVLGFMTKQGLRAFGNLENSEQGAQDDCRRDLMSKNPSELCEQLVSQWPKLCRSANLAGPSRCRLHRRSRGECVCAKSDDTILE